MGSGKYDPGFEVDVEPQLSQAKCSLEPTVRQCQTWILAKKCNRQFGIGIQPRGKVAGNAIPTLAYVAARPPTHHSKQETGSRLATNFRPVCELHGQLAYGARCQQLAPARAAPT